MGTRQAQHAAQITALLTVILLIVACGGEPPSYQYTGYLTEEIPPCTPVKGSSVDPCRTEENQESTGWASYVLDPEPPGLGEMLHLSRIHVAHLVVRATYLPDTVRCTSDKDIFRAHSYTGDSGGFKSIKCYSDLRVNDYVLGSGPPTLPVLMWRYRYWPSDATLNEEEYRINREQYESTEGLQTGERIFFIGPSIDAQTEAWEVMLRWRMERRNDGTVVAVHPERNVRRADDPTAYEIHRSKLEMELPTFKEAVMAAHQARLTANDGRTSADPGYPMLQTDANRLSQFFRGIGAYNHPNGAPVKAPPACGLAVPGGGYNSGLIRDCTTILAGKDILRETGTLNWDIATVINDWDGVTTGGTLARVTKVELDDEDLTWTIPADLGSLSELTHLDLSDNSLTGDIPRELGHLDNLEEVRLSGNSLTGCIPYGLKDVTTNDLSSLGLLYCPPAPSAVAARDQDGGVAEVEVTIELTKRTGG